MGGLFFFFEPHSLEPNVGSLLVGTDREHHPDGRLLSEDVQDLAEEHVFVLLRLRRRSFSRGTLRRVSRLALSACSPSFFKTDCLGVGGLPPQEILGGDLLSFWQIVCDADKSFHESNHLVAFREIGIVKNKALFALDGFAPDLAVVGVERGIFAVLLARHVCSPKLICKLTLGGEES